MGSLRKTVESLWLSLVGCRFDEEDFISNVMRDCGHDATGISKTDFLEMLNTGSCAAMQDMGWSCNEVLSYYLANHLGSAQFVRAMFIALCGVSAIQSGCANWDFMFDKIIMLLVQNMDKTDYSFRMEFLRSILCQNGEGRRS